MAVDKQKIIESTLAEIRAKMPNETIAQYKDYGGTVDVQTISTGSLAADSILGGGFAKGRLAMIVGHTSAGKTTLALTACAQLQKENPDAIILYVDAECALDPKYAKALGVDMDKVYLIQPDNGEDGYEAAEMFVRSGVCDLVIIDSTAALIPKAMFDVEYGDQAQIGMGARLDSQGISRLFAVAHKTGTTVLLINQWKKSVKTNAYDRTDGISGNYYMPGGETFKFYLSQLIEVQRVGKVYEKDENGVDQLVSNQTRVRVLKNKIAPPGRESDFFITFGLGVDQVQEAIELGIQSGDVIRTGRSLYNVAGDDENKFNGRPKFVAYLREHPEIVKDLRSKIYDKFLKDKNDDITIAKDTEVVKVDPIVE
jgi:recombination protein RecA